MRILSGLTAFTATAMAASAATFGVSPLSTFGGGDGWLSPGEGGYTFLGTGNLERGIAYGNGQLYLVSRNGGTNVRRLNPLTGSDLGGLNVTGISGGTFAANMVAVGLDGAVYVGNLTTAAGTNFKVYRWANDAAAPTVAYDGAPGMPRIGDSFAIFGGGAATRIVASGTGSSGFVVVDPTSGTAQAVSVPGTATGDFRLGITMIDGDTVIGSQGGTNFRVADFNGATGTLVASPATSSASERMVGYTVVGGNRLLATVDTATSNVRIYNATDPSNLGLLATVNNTSGALTANGNGTGSVAWGPVFGDTAILYAMNSNQGIQAFAVTIPEPGVGALVLVGAGLLLWRGRRDS